jgi:hypothetical protein
MGNSPAIASLDWRRKHELVHLAKA